jgi:HAD superfamily hydrolase (TIGR01662 family)
VKKGIIFDLDQTLIDSSKIEHLRKARKWPDVYENLPLTKVYDGIPEMLSELTAEYKIAVVTSSPSSYCSRALKFHELPIKVMVCFHDTQLRKPHPEPILEAVRKLGLHPNEVVSVGDTPADIQASKSAKVTAVAAIWGASDLEGIRVAAPDYIVASVEELRSLLRKL